MGEKAFRENLKAAREKKKARVKGGMGGKPRHNPYQRPGNQRKMEEERVKEEKRAKEQEERDWEQRRVRARRYLGVELTRPSSSGTLGGPAPIEATGEEKKKKE